MASGGNTCSYDYIIAGGGTAGCVLANRLSADPRCTVLMIEAGPWNSNPLYRVPIMGTHLYRYRYNNWNFRTQPEPGLQGRCIDWPRGRVIGGSSSINGMIFIRGAASDYDRWAQSGLPEWSYDRLLPYFKKLEAHEDGECRYRGGAGAIKVRRMRHKHALFEAFEMAAQQAGLPFNPDFNGATLDGVGRYEVNIADGQRWCAVRGYLDPVRHRPNLTVMTGATIRRVKLTGRRATGVELSRASGVVDIAATREVILSCGAIGSPATLLHSGIGPADDLGAAGIKPLHDLPGVGRNLQDHLNLTLFYESRVPDMFYDEARADRALLLLFNALFRRQGKGATVPHNGGAFLRSNPGLETPDLQIHFMAAGLKSRKVRWPLLAGGSDRSYGFAGHICHLRPESRGSITVSGPDPKEPPLIRANYLTAEADRIAMRAGYRALEGIIAQPAFDGVRGRRVVPDRSLHADQEIDGWIAANASTVFHPVGTCRMGTDSGAVVDQQLRVRGIAGLRVVDASIMPTIVSSNTHAPTIMIAERGADFILKNAA